MISRAYKAGASLVITLKEETRQYYNIEEGDILEIEIKNIKKAPKKQIRS